MAAEKIDVLAVMDSVASAIHRPAEGMVSIAHHELADFIQARAAVAELIEKADNAATALSNLIAARQVNDGYTGIVTDLTAALARIGGA